MSKTSSSLFSLAISLIVLTLPSCTNIASSHETVNASTPSQYFNASEILDIKNTFSLGSCSMDKLNTQASKYNFENVWHYVYDEAPRPLSTLSHQSKCYLSQSIELELIIDDFTNIPFQENNLDKLVETNTIKALSFYPPLSLIPECKPGSGRPTLISYNKNEKGHIERTIIAHEEFFEIDCL